MNFQPIIKILLIFIVNLHRVCNIILINFFASCAAVDDHGRREIRLRVGSVVVVLLQMTVEISVDLVGLRVLASCALPLLVFCH